MKKEIYLSTLGLILAELNIFYGEIVYGLIIHVINILAIIIMIIFLRFLELKEKKILQGIIFLILLQMIYFSMPPFFSFTILQQMLIYLAMYVPMYYIIRVMNISSKKVRFAIILIGGMVLLYQYETLDPLTLETIYISGGFITITLIIFLIVKSLLLDTRFYNKYVSDTLGMISSSLLMIFGTIVTYQIMTIGKII